MIQIYHHFDDIEDYRHDWNRLAELQKSALLSYEWFSCCARAFHAHDTLYLVCILEDNALVAVAPLYRSSQGGLGYLLQIIGNRRLYEPTSLLFRDMAALKLLLMACADIGRPLLLGRCYRQMDMSAFFPKFSLRGVLVSMAAAGSQYLSLETDFAAYENSLSSRRRYDIRRARKKAQLYGKLDHIVDRVDQANIVDLLDKAYEIENRSWKKETGSSMALNEDLRRFFSCLFGNISDSNRAVIAFLTIDGQPVASHLAIQRFDRLWILKIGYDRDYASCSPGILLTHELIRYAYDNGLVAFEFLGSEETWIELWKPAIRQYHSQLFYPLSYNGIIGLLADASKILLSRIRGTRLS
jgi:CelD/BcsL family acetyltransferase involved in cellulose biosynthesis